MPKEMMKQENPWVVSNIQEFLYYNCPECDTKERDSEVFIQHALDNHEMSKSYLNQPEIEKVPQNQDEISDHEMEEVKDTKPTQEELKASDKKFMELRLFKLKVEPDVLLEASDSETCKADFAQDMDYEPGSDSDSDVDIPAEDEDDVKPDEDDVKPDEFDVKPDKAAFCDICDKFFKSKLSLKVHITMKHSEQRKCDQCDTTKANKELMARHCVLNHFNTVSCHKCEYKCHSKLMLDAHWKTFHKLRYRFDVDNEGNFTCKVCNLKNQNEDEMKYHQWEHQDIKWRYKCELCHATFVKRYDYEGHNDTVHMGKNLECEQCDFSTKNRTSLIRHKKLVHEVTTSSHICTICGKKVVCMKSHMTAVHHENDEGGTCDQCGMFFEGKRALLAHKYRKHTRKFQVCTLCEKFFVGNRKNKLIDHYTDKHGIFCNKKNTYVCHICMTRVTSTKELAEHYHTVHESKDDFQCTKCDHNEPTKALLSIHCIDAHEMNPFNDSELVNVKTLKAVQVQEDDKAYQCQFCNKRLTSKVTLNNHIKQVHDKSNHVKCEQCPCTFNYPSELKKHVLAKHTAATKFPCSQCSYVTNRKTDLKNHIRKLHEKDLKYKCTLCEGQFHEPRNLQKHMLKDHDILYKY